MSRLIRMKRAQKRHQVKKAAKASRTLYDDLRRADSSYVVTSGTGNVFIGYDPSIIAPRNTAIGYTAGYYTEIDQPEDITNYTDGLITFYESRRRPY